MLLDDFLDLLRALFYLLAGIFFLMALPFICCHVADTWNAPEYPYSGFTPDCPTWEEPENTLPPTDVQATCCTDDL